MTARLRPSPSSFSGIRLSVWAWMSILFQFASLVNSLSSPFYNTDQPPRAALVTLAHEHDLSAMLFSMSQLEGIFNNRYHYHWVFFSTDELSEEFKRSTSNATAATCIYEVIPDENWSVPKWIDRGRLRASETFDRDHHSSKAVLSLRQIYRWSSGLFAKEKRLRYYDWFWRVEPGARFTSGIDIDVFKFMRDNHIAYVSHKAMLNKTNTRTLSPQIRAFIRNNSHLLHEHADVSWLVESPKPEACNSILADEGVIESLGQHEYENDQWETRYLEGSAGPGDFPWADWQQDDGKVGKEGSGGQSLAETFTSWLSDIYENSLYPTFEIGSLAFFRSPNHLAFFEHLDRAGEFYYGGVEDVPVHTLSASMFLPKQSVRNFRKKDSREHHHASTPNPTPGPEFYLYDFEADSTSSIYGGNKRGGAISAADLLRAQKACLERWELMARDFDRQDGIPRLLSGNTVVDERKFALA